MYSILCFVLERVEIIMGQTFLGHCYCTHIPHFNTKILDFIISSYSSFINPLSPTFTQTGTGYWRAEMRKRQFTSLPLSFTLYPLADGM